jgi:hypothetical protein
MDWLRGDMTIGINQWQDDLATAMHKKWFGWVDTFVDYVKTKWTDLMNFMGVGPKPDFQRVPGGTVQPKVFPGGPPGWVYTESR